MLVMAAVMIPVFLLLTALVVDVGNWYTHKRQLQNRADAAAFAAGVEYAKNWKACVQTGDTPLMRASTGGSDRGRGPAVRRRPRGSRLRTGEPAGHAPQHRDREPGEPRRRHQLERPGLQRRHRLHGRRRHAAAGNPCFMHTPGTTSPRGGHWTDVRVKERNLPSLFGSVGLPLSRNGARARDRDPPGDQRPPVPAARGPEQRDHEGAGALLRRVPQPSSLATQTSRRSPPPTRAASPRRAAARSGASRAARPAVGDRNLGRSASPCRATAAAARPTCPSASRCGSRAATRSTSTHTCAQLARDAVRGLLPPALADPRLERRQRRLPGAARRRPPDRRLRHAPRRRVLRHAARRARPTAATARTSEVNWGDRDDPPNLNVPAQLQVTVNGVAATSPGSLDGPHGGDVWTRAVEPALTANPGANTVTIASTGTTTTPRTTTRAGSQRAAETRPASTARTEPPTGRSSAPRARPARSRSCAPRPRPVESGFAAPCRATPTRTERHRRQRRHALPDGRDPQRAEDRRLHDAPPRRPAGEPDAPLRPATSRRARSSPRFRYGCKPWYGANPFTATPNPPATGVVVEHDEAVPRPRPVVLVRRPGRRASASNSCTNPWRCVLTAPGMSTGQVGDDIAVATDNCDNINNNSCQTLRLQLRRELRRQAGRPDRLGCEPAGPAKLGSATRASSTCSSSRTRRSKGLTGAGDTIPVLGFASFYVMDWGRRQRQPERPLPRHDVRPRRQPATPSHHARAPRARSPACSSRRSTTSRARSIRPRPASRDQLTPCRVTLVR